MTAFQYRPALLIVKVNPVTYFIGMAETAPADLIIIELAQGNARRIVVYFCHCSIFSN